jgi:hypothetical protein
MKPLNQLQRQYQEKPTEELLEIWRQNDRTIYRAEVFETIKQILTERQCDLPPQEESVFTADQSRNLNVVVTGIDVPFGDLVFFMVKWTIASVPALIIIGLIGGVILMLLGGINQFMRGLNGG